MVLVREITADDWQLMRDVRLTSLAEAPYAFGSSYEREAAFTEATWRGRFNEQSVTFVAHEESAGPGPAALAGVYVKGEDPDLVAMWVRPAARGRGVGEALVAAAASWVKARDLATLFLWVTESNAPARRLYERCGFIPTGENMPLPSDPALRAIRMRSTL